MLKAILLVLVLVSIIIPSATTSTYADNKEDDLTERDVAVLCDASEDYEAHKEQCDKLYDSLEQDATLVFASSSDDKDDYKYLDNHGKDKGDDDYSESEAWNEKDYKEAIKKQNDDNDDKDEKYPVKSKQKDGSGEVTRYYDDKDDAEEAYKNLDRDELPHGDKSYSDWEYDDEEHPSLK